VTFPIPEIALEQHQAILGKTGSGKSSTAKLIVEHVVEAGHRVCILDPIKSDWWGITSSADGKRPGLPFDILGGPHGHVGLHASAGKAIGELVASGELAHSIVDMADFAPGGSSQFFIDFAQVLLKRMRGVLYLVMEEAHEFAPKERAGIGNENMAVHYAKTLATAGRSKGIRLIVVTQRTQSLHNALLGSCDTMIVHRMTAPADQEPVVKWLKANTDKTVLEEVSSSLSSLPTGTGWICSGEARIFAKVAFPRIQTYDNTATPTGDDGPEVKTAPVDQKRLRAIIGEAVAEVEANDPKALKAEIAMLKASISAASKSGEKVTADPVLLAAEYDRGLVDGIERGKVTGIALGLTRAQAAVNALRVPEIAAEPSAPAQRAVVNRSAPVERAAKPVAPKGVDPLYAVAMQVWPAKLSWGALAAACGRKARGGHFNTARKRLIEGGLVREEDNLVVPTVPPAVPDGVSPADLLEQHLPQPAAKMFAAIRGKPGITIIGLASVLQMQPRGGHWNTGMSILRSNGLVEDRGGALFVTPELIGDAT
jgi:hypothetical protein